MATGGTAHRRASTLGLALLALGSCIDGTWVDLGNNGASGGQEGTAGSGTPTGTDGLDGSGDETGEPLPPPPASCERSDAWQTEQRALPPAAAAIDVQIDGGAVGDGIADDTEAIRTALALSMAAWEQVYIPPGTYRLTDTIEFPRQVTLVGAGAGHSVLVLDDAAPGFGDPDAPRPVLRVFHGNNTTHHANLRRLGVDVGADNPGAIGIEFTSHNGGGIAEVILTAAPSSGSIGLDLGRADPGPAHFSDLLVDGFARGVQVRWGIHGSTFEHLAVRNQGEAGLWSSCHPLQIRCARSDNVVPFLVHDECSDFGMSIVRNATLVGGASGSAAIEAAAQTVVLHEISTEGYGSALVDSTGATTGPVVSDFVTVPHLGIDGQPVPMPEVIAVPSTPDRTWPDPTTWTNVRDFAEEPSPEDWTGAIQAAIDSGATTLVFPNTIHAHYPSAGPIIIRGQVRHVFGLSARFSDAEVVVEDLPADAVLFIDQLRFGTLRQRSAATVVVSHAHGNVVTEPDSGDVFLQGQCCGTLSVVGSRVFASSLELAGVTIDGGVGWVMGMRAVGDAAAIEVLGGGVAELWGGLLDPAAPAVAAAFRHQDSRLVVGANLFGPYPAFAETMVEDMPVTVDPPFTPASKALYVAEP